MNIFILDNDINKNVIYLPDKHIVKMPVESAQLLCTAFYNTNSIVDGLYRASHLKHPCSLWLLESLDNWLWLREYTLKLGEEYTYRYHSYHNSVNVVRNLPIIETLPKKGLTPFAKCVPDELRELDAVEAYRQYFINYKQHLKKYTRREVPEWWI